MPALFTQPRSAVRAIATARAVSITGGAAAFAALNLAIYQKTGSEKWLAATMFLTFGVAGIAGLFAGMLGDRFDRQKVMIGSDLVSGVFFTALIFTDDPGWMLVFATLSAIGEAPLWAASAAAIPNLVSSAKDISWANSLSQMGHGLGILLGPAMVGVVYDSFGAKPIFVMNAASFVVSAGLTLSVRGTFAGAREDEGEHQGFMAGVRFVVHDKVLRWMNMAWFLVVAGMGIVMTADVPFAELFDADDPGSYYAWIIGSWGFGSLLGALVGRRITAESEGRALLWGTLVFTGALGVVAPATVFWPVVLGLFASGLGEGFGMVAELHITQRRAPDAVRSRVIAAGQALVSIAFAVGFVAAAPILAAVGPRWSYVTGSVLGVVAALLLIPAVRELRRTLAAQRAAGEEPVAVDDLSIAEFPAPDEGTLSRES